MFKRYDCHFIQTHHFLEKKTCFLNFLITKDKLGTCNVKRDKNSIPYKSD